jgi:hypothetical protein
LDDAALRAELAKLSEAADRLAFQSSASAGVFERVGKSLGMTSENISKTSFGIKQIYSGAISFNRSLTSSEVSFTKYSNTVSQVTSGLGSIFSTMGPLGQALSAVTDVVGKLVTSVFEQNDQYLNAYDTLAKFGYAGEGTADALFDLTKNTGYLGDKVGDLVGVTTGLGNDLTYLGNTAGQGIKTFFDITTITKEQRAEQIRLGYSQKEITQNQADFIKNQTKLGVLRTNDLKTLRANSLNYGKQLMELAALTGQTPEAIKAQQAEDLKDYAFNVMLRQEGKKAGAKSQEVMDRLMGGVTQVGAQFGADKQKGFREILSTGLAQSDEAKAMLRVAGSDIFKWVKQFKSGEISITEFNKRYGQAYENFEKNMGETAARNKEFAENMGATSETARGAAKELSDTREDLVKRQTEAAMKPQDGGLKETQIKLIETQLEVQTAFQTLVKLISEYVNPAFEYLLKGLDKLTQGFMQTLTTLGVVDPEFPYMFKDAGELSKMLTERQGKLAELYQDREKSTNLQAMGVDLSAPADIAKKAYIDAQIKLQEKEIDGIRKQLKKLTGSDRPITPTGGSSSGSSLGSGGGTFSTTNNLNFGISSGPMSGYPEMLNDKLQAVVPLPDGKSIPVSFKNLPSQLSSKRRNPLLESENIDGILRGYASSVTNNVNQVNNNLSVNQSSDDKSNIFNLVSSKMDSLLDNITKNNQLQSDMLVYLRR